MKQHLPLSRSFLSWHRHFYLKPGIYVVYILDPTIGRVYYCLSPLNFHNYVSGFWFFESLMHTNPIFPFLNSFGSIYLFIYLFKKPLQPVPNVSYAVGGNRGIYTGLVCISTENPAWGVEQSRPGNKTAFRAMLPFQLPLCFVKRRTHGFLVLFQNLFKSFKNFFKTHYALCTWPLFLLLIPFLCQSWKQVASLKSSKMAYANTCMAKKNSRSGRKKVLCWLFLCRLWPHNWKGQILMKTSWLPLMPFSSSQWEVGSPPCLELKQWLASGLCIIPKKKENHLL